MIRIPITERPDWQKKAKEFGFTFHTMHGEPYWDERAYYRFSLEQIEKDIEEPTEEIHEMCLSIVDDVLRDEELLQRFCIPENQWDFVRQSWLNGDPSLYSRFDFAYDGKSPAKFYENNADTPTSVYETGFWQWLWLEDNVNAGALPRHADQFNSLQEKLVNRFKDLEFLTPERVLHFTCCKDTEEDRGTVQYLEDCAKAAGLETRFVYLEDIGLDEQKRFTDADNYVITWLFKLYPWEFMFEEEYGQYVNNKSIRFIEPAWKSILSNKALLPMLWRKFPNHPNLLPAFFEDEMKQLSAVNHPAGWVKKPIFSREGANISLFKDLEEVSLSSGPYGEEGYIYQAMHALPKFGGHGAADGSYALIGSWLVDNEAAGISIREDSHLVTQDMSRYLPHIIA